jgi:hypothetical protein
MFFFEGLKEKKAHIYEYNGIRPLTPLFNNDDGDFYITHQRSGKNTCANPESFFTPFHNMRDFSAQLKAPFAMFIVNATIGLTMLLKPSVMASTVLSVLSPTHCGS